MQEKPFVIIVLVLLLAQPFVVVSSMPFAFNENAVAPKKDIIASQGTRLEGDDLTDHVPVLIDDEADFSSQGWPGAGTEGNPWIISGLNITYDVGKPAIEITNIDSYFVIRDCYIGQISVQPGVYFENTSHSRIEYVSIISAGVGIRTVNANNTILSHAWVSATVTGTELEYSHFSEINSSHFDERGIYVFYSKNVTIANNEVTTYLGDGIHLNFCNYTLIESNRIDDGAGHGIAIEGGYYIEIISNTVDSAGNCGIYTESIYTNINENIILNSGSDGILFMNDWITITSNHINDSGVFSIHSYGASNGVVSHNIISDSPNFFGIAFEGGGFQNYTISDNYFDNLYGGFGVLGGRWINVINNHGRNLGFPSIPRLVLLQNAPDSNVVDNTLDYSYYQGIYTSNCDRTSIIGNTINNTQTAIIASGVNMTIQDNTVFDAQTGLQIVSGSDNADVSLNHFEYVTTAISVSADDVTIDSNVILDVETGVNIQAGAEEAEITNNHIDSADTGLYLTNANMSAVGNTILNSVIGIHVVAAPDLEVENNIVESSLYGIMLESAYPGLFAGNNFSECSVYIPGYPSLANLNHSFVGNYVNNKLLYYNINQPGLILDGNDYGEIILVNCSDATIDGGIFTWSSVAFQIFYSDRVDISNIHVIDNSLGMSIGMSTNLSIVDSIFEGRGFNDAILGNNVNGFYAENLEFTSIDSNAIRILNANPFEIRDSHFENIASSGIAVWSGQNGLIEGNEVFNASWGIRLVNTQSTLITNNSLKWNMYGIYSTDESDANNATFNNVHDNWYGIRMDDSWSWFIYNNSVRWNDYGLYITITNNQQWIYNNTFALNAIYNGFDDGADAWDDRVDGGNYWNDYSGTGVYNIPGGSSVDHFPMQYIVKEPIINTPEDVWYAEGSEGNFITWVPFDDSLKEWAVTIDGAPWKEGIWNFEDITVNIDGLAYGTHTVFVLVEDMDRNTINDTVIVHVFDDTPPEITGPPDTWLFEDASDQTITWVVSDLNPDDYTVYLNGEVFDTDTWTTGNLVVDFEGVTEGLYEVTIIIYDADGNEATDTIMLLMIDDNTAPLIDSPDDVEYIEGETGNTVVWSPTDEFPDRFEVTFNGTPYGGDEWGGSRISVNVDGLPVGRYVLSITVYDKSGNFATDSLNITIIPLIPIPPQPLDWLLILIVGAVAGAVIVVIAIIYYTKRRSSSSY